MYLLITIIVAIVCTAADQISKWWVNTSLVPVGDIPLWEGVFHLHYARNIGAAFSMLEGQQLLFIIFTAAACVAVLVYMFLQRKNGGLFLSLTLGMIMGGAVGNGIDRVTQGYVTDFLYFKLINFAIFNVADCCVVVGAILLGIYILFIYKPKPKENKPESQEN